MKSMENKDLDLFKKQLEKLLLKFPSLPEFTLTIRPRVSIDVDKKYIAPKALLQDSPADIPVRVSQRVSDKNDKNIATSLEANITPGRLNEMKQSLEYENQK